MVSSLTLGNVSTGAAQTAGQLPAIYSSGSNFFTRSLNFLDGDWARGMGADLRSSWKSGTQFSARDSYHNFFGKRNIEYMADELVDTFKKNPVRDIESAARASIQSKFGVDVIRKNKGLTEQLTQTAKEVAEKVGKKPGKIASFFSKIPGMKRAGKFLKGCFRNLGPIMIVGFAIKEAYDEIQNGGGILGLGKVLCRTVINEAGFIGGSMLAGVLFGVGGFWAGLAGFALGIGGSMLGGWLGGKIFRTKTDEVEEAQEQAQEQAQQQGAGAGNGAGGSLNLPQIPSDPTNDPVLAYLRQQDGLGQQPRRRSYTA